MPGIGLIKGFNDSDNKEIKVEGFDALQRQIKRLSDSVKRKEIHKIQSRIAKPLVEKAKLEAPEGPTGNLVDSIGIIKGRSVTYPNIYVAPKVGKKGKARIIKGGRSNNSGFHGHLVHDGTSFRRKKRGKKSSTGVMPANPFLQRAYNSLKGGLISGYQKELARYVRGRIKKLSK